jgi:hypothetical protein
MEKCPYWKMSLELEKLPPRSKNFLIRKEKEKQLYEI